MIASLGPNLPLPLLAATGAYAGALPFAMRSATPRADGWMETKFAPWARFVLEDWAEGRFDNLQTVVFSRADDNAQRLYYYLCELQRQGRVGGPRPELFDCAMIRRDSSRKHMLGKVQALARQLEVSEDELAAANAAHDDALLPDVPPAGPTLLLAGTPPPDDRMAAAAQDAGLVADGRTLAEIWAQGPGHIGDGEPFAALADAISGARNILRGHLDPAADLARRLAASDVRGCVLWCTEDDEAIVWHVPAMKELLAEASIPTLLMTRRNWTCDDGALDEVRAFARGIAA